MIYKLFKLLPNILVFNYVTNDKILVIKLKSYADVNLNVAEIMIFLVFFFSCFVE